MSRAFVREREDVGPEPPPDLKVSAHPNRVTRRGLRLMEEAIARLEQELAAKPDDTRLPWLKRDLRYWTERRATAQIVEPPESGSEDVAFGSRVTIQREGHAPETVEIVGEDESDPATGRLSWVAPMAAALIGAQAGESVTVGNRVPPLNVEILLVQNGPLVGT